MRRSSTFGFGGDKRGGAISEPERGSEKDVRGRATFDEIARDIRARLDHPLGGGRTVIDVARVDVRAGVEQEIDHRARAREMERRLSVTAALVHALGILGKHRLEQIDAIEMRGRACVDDRTGREQTLGDGGRRTI